MSPQVNEYLEPSYVIDADSPSIQAKAGELAAGLESDIEKSVALFYFVRDSITFDPYAPGELIEYNRASTVLERGSGFCYQKAIVLAAMARSLGIPARLGFADIRNHQLSARFVEKMYGSNLLVYHGYTELFIDGSWIIATPAYDKALCDRKGYVPVEFDGRTDATFPKQTLSGEPHVEYVKQHGHYADLPWQEIFDARNKFLADLGVDVDEFMTRWLSDREPD